MLRPKKYFVPGIIFLVVASLSAMTRSGLAESAAEECKSKPDGTSPPGSHWFYRINRADGRHCWYLGPHDKTKARSAVSEATSRGSSSSSKTRHQTASVESGFKDAPVDDASAPVQKNPAQTEPSRQPAASSAGSLGGATETQAEFAVRWPDPPSAPAFGASGSAVMSSSYAKRPAPTDLPQPPPSAVAEPVRAGLGSTGRFRPTVVTGTFALALLLAAAILKLARRPMRSRPMRSSRPARSWRPALSRRPDRWNSNLSERAAGWFGLCRQLAADLLKMAVRELKAAVRRHGSLSQKLMPSDRTLARTDPTHELKASLQQLMHDLRQAEAATEPPRKFEPDARHQLRLLLGKAAARRVELHSFSSEEGPGIAARDSRLSDPPSVEPLMRPRYLARAG
jgi:hypothetical protein